MSQAEGDRSGRRADVNHRHCALQPVVPGLVEEIADSDHTHVFADKVYGQGWCATAKHAGDGIEFLSSILEVGSGYEEVRCAEGSAGGK